MTGFYKSIVDFNTKCIQCQEVKPKIAIDTTGPYPTSYNGNKYLTTVIDLLTSYPEAYWEPDKSAETVAKVWMTS